MLTNHYYEHVPRGQKMDVQMQNGRRCDTLEAKDGATTLELVMWQGGLADSAPLLGPWDGEVLEI